MTSRGTMPPGIDLDLGFSGTHVVVTGGAGLIGSIVVDHFAQAGAVVTSLDSSYASEGAAGKQANCSTVYCDISDEESVKQAFEAAVSAHGPIEVCVALASLDYSVLEHSSFVDASFAQLKRVLDVNVAGTWLTAREWLRNVAHAKEKGQRLHNVNLVIIGSESGRFGERRNVEYSLGKSAVQGGLLMSLSQEVVQVWPGARVNVVAPGPVATARWELECKEDPELYWLETQATMALGEPIPREAIAKSILFLASQNFSSHVHGQVINVDGGKMGKVLRTKGEAAMHGT